MIKEFCEKHGLTEDQFYGRVEIPGSLHLNGVKEIPEGFNPVVGAAETPDERRV